MNNYIYFQLAMLGASIISKKCAEEIIVKYPLTSLWMDSCFGETNHHLKDSVSDPIPHRNIYIYIYIYIYIIYDIVGIQCLFGILLFDKIIVQEVPKQYFCSILCLYTDTIHL